MSETTIITTATIINTNTNSNHAATPAIEHPYKNKLLIELTDELKEINKCLDDSAPNRVILTDALVDLTSTDDVEMKNANEQREKNKANNSKRKSDATSLNLTMGCSKQQKSTRNKVSLAIKQQVIKLVAQKILNYDQIAKQLALKGANTVKTIMRNKDKIQTALQNSNNNPILTAACRLRDGKLPMIEKMLVSWIHIQRSKQPPLPVTYEGIQMKADEFRKQILTYFPKTEDFKKKEEMYKNLITDYTEAKFCNDWVHSFLTRNRLASIIEHGEGNSAPLESVLSGRIELKTELCSYKLSDIYNIDELALFYGLLPKRTIEFIDNQNNCKKRGNKKDKRRITVALCCNADGSHKFRPIVIGKAKRPRSFTGIRMENLPCEYYNSKKAWMNFSIFSKILTKINLKIFEATPNRQIILLIDGAGAHIGIEKLSFSNMKVRLLPPNTTSHLQPLDAGIIRATKARYRSQLLQHILYKYDVCQKYENPTVLDAALFLVNAWKQVTTQTIKNCWKHTDILAPSQNIELAQELDVKSLTNVEAQLYDDISEQLQKLSLEPLTADEYIEVDSNEPTEEEVSDDLIVTAVLQDNGHITKENIATDISSDTDSDIEIQTVETPPEKFSKQQILQSCHILSTYMMQLQSTKEVPIEKMQEIVDFIEQTHNSSLKQLDIRSFCST